MYMSGLIWKRRIQNRKTGSARLGKIHTSPSANLVLTGAHLGRHLLLEVGDVLWFLNFRLYFYLYFFLIPFCFLAIAVTLSPNVDLRDSGFCAAVCSGSDLVNIVFVCNFGFFCGDFGCCVLSPSTALSPF